jgi:hypothetical protein
MFIGRLILINFRCFGLKPRAIDLASGLSALVGAPPESSVAHTCEGFGVSQRRPCLVADRSSIDADPRGKPLTGCFQQGVRPL